MPKVGEPIDLNLQLHDGAVDKFPMVVLRDEDGVELGASPVSLVHVGQGLYQSDVVIMPDTREVTGVFITYVDAGHTVESITHQRDLEVFYPSSFAEIIAILTSIAGSGFTESTDSLEKIRELLDIINVRATLPSNVLIGMVESDEIVEGEILDDIILGLVESQDAILLGLIEDIILDGQVETLNEIEGTVKECA